MTVSELINRLEDLAPQAEIRFVYQANYPLQDDIAGVWEASEEVTCINCDNVRLISIVDGDYRWACPRCETRYEPDEVVNTDEPEVVYIVSAGQNYRHPYGPKAAFENYA